MVPRGGVGGTRGSPDVCPRLVATLSVVTLADQIASLIVHEAALESAILDSPASDRPGATAPVHI